MLHPSFFFYSYTRRLLIATGRSSRGVGSGHPPGKKSKFDVDNLQHPGRLGLYGIVHVNGQVRLVQLWCHG
jgi:hypothetical protein